MNLEDPKLAANAVMELELLIADVLKKNGSIQDLLLADHSYWNRRLARYYIGDDTKRGGFIEQLETSKNNRLGILSKLGYLTSHTAETDSRLLFRGIATLSSLLCFDTPPAPPLPDAPPDGVPGNTVRSRIEFHESSPSCKGCHVYMDSIGFAFEHFDPAGKHITKYLDGTKVDANGSLNLLGIDGSWTNLAELSQILAKSKTVADCMSKQFSRVAFSTKKPDPKSCKVKGNKSDPTQPLLELILAPIADSRFIQTPPKGK